MTRAELIQYITDNVYPNARNEVTAPMVRDSLLEIVDFLGDAATYNIGMVASGNQGLVTGGNVNTAIALALLPYYTAAETGQAIDDAIARIGLGQAAYKDLGQVADGNTGLVMGGQVYSAINAAITSAIKFQGVSDTPLTDGSTTNPIQIDGQSYTAKKGDMVVYAGNEFLWVGNKWQQMGDESSYALKTISISGTGYLTGGGDLTQSRTLDISATAKGYIDHGEAAYNYFPNGVLDSTHLPSMYIGTTSVQFSAAAQNLTGISSVRATTNVMTLFEWDSTNSAWHFHGNIYTDGWFSGGGISSGGGGGGGGGIDPVAMWRLLTNDPSLTQYDNYTKISADHINFPVTSVVGLTGAITKQQIAQALELGSLAYKNSLSASDIPDLSGTYLPLTAGSTKSLSGELWFTAGTKRVAFRDSNGTYSGCVSWSEGVNERYIELYSASSNRSLRLTDATTTAPVYWNGGAEWIMYHAGNFRAGYEYVAPSALNSYVAKSGDTMTGSLSCSTSGANISWGNITIYGGGTNNSVNSMLIGDDAIIGDCNVDGAFGIKGQNGNNAGLRFFTSSGTAIGGIQSSNGSLQWYDTGGSYRNIYHSGNSNKNDVAWTCSTLTAATSITTPYCVDYRSGKGYFIGYLGDSIGTGDGLACSAYGANPIVFSNSYTERMRITGDGKVAIGTTSTSYALGVNGSIGCTTLSASGTITSDGANPSFSAKNNVNYTPYISYLGANVAWEIDTISPGDFRLYMGGAATYVMSVSYSTGFIGIGTTSPAYKLDVNGDVHYTGLIKDSKGFGTADTESYQPVLGALSTARSVGLNIRGYSSYGLFAWVQGSGNSVLQSGRTDGDATAYALCLNPLGGRVGVGTYNPANALDVIGVVYASTGIYTDGWFSGGGLASSSDRRLKKNIKNFGYTPELLLAIRPREWDWKEGSAMVGHAAGFVAQEIEPVMPYAVDGTRNFKALFYDRFHALEVSALQDHEKRIVELEKEVKQKDKEIARLKKRLNMN